MNESNRRMKNKISMVKQWLEKAETSYDDDAAAKGQLQLMLAKAEMQHLEEAEAPITSIWPKFIIPMMIVALLIIGGTTYYHNQQAKAGVVVTESVANQSDLGNSATPWKKELQTNYLAPLVLTSKEHSPTVMSKAVEEEQNVSGNKVEHVVEKSSAATTKPEVTVMNANEIRQTVYDASRTLRGN